MLLSRFWVCYLELLLISRFSYISLGLAVQPFEVESVWLISNSQAAPGHTVVLSGVQFHLECLAQIGNNGDWHFHEDFLAQTGTPSGGEWNEEVGLQDVAPFLVEKSLRHEFLGRLPQVGREVEVKVVEENHRVFFHLPA